MKWFKHDTDASNDPKIKKLKKKFGMVGYGVYFNLLELIARKMESNVEEFGFLPADWDDESLELEFGLDTNNVRTMFDYMCEVGLFEKKQGRLYNSKIQSRCDDYTSRLLRKEDYNAKKSNMSEQSPNSVRTKSDKVRLDKNRIEENRKEEELSNESIPSKTLKNFRDQRRIESGRPPMTPRKSTEKQKAFMAAAKTGIDYFKAQGQEQHGMQFLEYTNDKRNAIVLKLVMNAYEKIGDLKELIDWWFQGEGEWADYEPERCFSIKTIERFKNTQPKEIKPFIINKHE